MDMTSQSCTRFWGYPFFCVSKYLIQKKFDFSNEIVRQGKQNHTLSYSLSRELVWAFYLNGGY